MLNLFMSAGLPSLWRLHSFYLMLCSAPEIPMFSWLRREPASLAEHRRQMAEALADYPVYDPPHRQGPNFPRSLQGRSEADYKRLLEEFRRRGRENFSYFMECRDVRRAALSAFLARFDVRGDVDDTGLAAVSAWCPGNCGALVPGLREDTTRQAFFQLSVPWTEKLRGLNVIFDLGIFFGECITIRNRQLHWTYKPGGSNGGVPNHSGYDIAGFRNPRDSLDPVGRMYRECGNDEVDLRSGSVGRAVRRDGLSGMVRDFSTR